MICQQYQAERIFLLLCDRLNLLTQTYIFDAVFSSGIQEPSQRLYRTSNCRKMCYQQARETTKRNAYLPFVYYRFKVCTVVYFLPLCIFLMLIFGSFPILCLICSRFSLQFSRQFAFTLFLLIFLKSSSLFASFRLSVIKLLLFGKFCS